MQAQTDAPGGTTNAATEAPPTWVATLADAPGVRPVPRAAGPDMSEVRDFFAQYREYTGASEEAIAARLVEVEAEIAARGTYAHTTDELTVGAKIAWYNHTRCVGKLYWRSLAVRDFRHVTTAEEIRDACFEHLEYVANGGRVRATITIFAPETPGAPAPRLHNGQLVAYAGYKLADGTVVGDGARIELTDLAVRAGWTPPETPGPFDVLPLIIETSDGVVSTHDVPAELLYEVDIEHPTIPGLAELGLRWYGFPSIADMGMSIGGIVYPTSPFTGWYVAPELSARDFSDTYRYNMLPEIATALGIDTTDRRSLWKDRAVLELTTAVLWSYDRAGMRMDDHHTATEKFHKWTQAEKRRGREVDADWTWMIPPVGASLTPVFHETYRNEERLPNFVRPDKVAASCPVGGDASAAGAAAGGCPFHHSAPAPSAPLPLA